MTYQHSPGRAQTARVFILRTCLCSVTCQAPPACPQASVEPEQVGGYGPLAVGGRGELRRRPSWALWGAAQPPGLVLLPLPELGVGPA